MNSKFTLLSISLAVLLMQASFVCKAGGEEKPNTKANLCDNPPAWPKAPKPSKDPLATMKWANDKEKDKFGCTRNGGKKFHAGIDLKAAVGTDCFAVENAKVTSVGSGSLLGKWVAIEFTKNGQKYGVAYCHLDKQSVSEGDNVTSGQKIGETGKTGNVGSDEPHLHLEIQSQKWVAGDASKAVNSNTYME